MGWLVVPFLVLSFLVPIPVWAAITFDTASSSGGLTSTSHSHTVAADANIAIICVSQREDGGAAAQAASVTLGGQAATYVDGVVSASGVTRAEMWVKLTPLTGAQTVAVTGGVATDRMVTGVMTFKNVAQTGTFNTVSKLGSPGTSTDADLNGIASAVGELVVLCGASRVNSATPSPDPTVPVSTEQYEFGFDSGGVTHEGFGYTEAGASPTIDMRIDLASAQSWALIAVSMRELASSASFGPLRRRQ